MNVVIVRRRVANPPRSEALIVITHRSVALWPVSCMA